MPTDLSLTRLLAGPYAPPPLRKGDRAHCLYRDCDVVITSWSDARISWPRRRALHGGGSGLSVDDELRRAVLTESAQAIMHGWGVSSKAVWNWPRAFGVTMWGTEGSRRSHQQTSEKGAAAPRERGLIDARCDRMSERSKRLDLARNFQEYPRRPL